MKAACSRGPEALPWGIWAVEKVLSAKRARWGSGKTKTGYQIFIFFLTYWIYAIYTLTRRPFSVVKIVLCPPCANESFNFSSVQTNFSGDDDETAYLEGWPPFNSTNGRTLLGSIDYSLIFAYAIGLYISGYVADRVNLRYFLTFGMAGSGLAAVCLGLGYFFRVHHLAYFIIFQIMAGFMQATGWPGLLGITGKWFGEKNRGKILGVWGSCSFVGSILGYFIPSFFILSENVEDSPWGWAFLVPAFIIFVTALLAFFFLVTDPKHLGFQPAVQATEVESIPMEDVKGAQKNDEDNDSSLLIDENEESPPDTRNHSNKALASTKMPKSKAVGILQALLIPGVVEYSMAFFFVKLVVYAINFWLPFYVAATYPSLGGSNAARLTILFDVGGISGGVFIGVVSDKIKSRSVVIAPMLLIGMPILFMLRYLGHVSLVFYSFMLLLTGFFVNGPHIIITGAVANDLGTHKSLRENQQAKSIVGGIVDGTGSLGAALGPLLVGLFSDAFVSGWDTVFYMFMVSCFLSATFLSRLIIKDSKRLASKCRARFSRDPDASSEVRSPSPLATADSAHPSEEEEAAAAAAGSAVRRHGDSELDGGQATTTLSARNIVLSENVENACSDLDTMSEL